MQHSLPVQICIANSFQAFHFDHNRIAFSFTVRAYFSNCFFDSLKHSGTKNEILTFCRQLKLSYWTKLMSFSCKIGSMF